MVSVGRIVRHDLDAIHNIVQNSHGSYLKEVIIGVLRDAYSKDSYYHYVADEFGFPKVKSHRDLPLGSGYDDDEVTRIFIGEAFRHDVVMYPAILVKKGNIRYVPVSINRNKETVQYESIKIVDGYGNEAVTTIPKYFVLQGAWEGSVNIDIISRDILSRDEITSFCALFFTDIVHDILLRAGILVKKTNIGAPSEGSDRNQEKIYKNIITLEIRSEWKREIPIHDLIETINFCVDFGRTEVVTDPVIAPNLTINTVIPSILEDISLINTFSKAPYENPDLMARSASALFSSGTISVLDEEDDELKLIADTDFYVDEQNVTGNASDSHPGTSASAPLASWFRATQLLHNGWIRGHSVTIHALSDANDDSFFTFRGLIEAPYILRIVGEAETELLSEIAITDRANYAAGIQRPWIECGSTDWGALNLIGKRARVVGGGGSQVGALFWLEEADSLNANRVYINRPYEASPPTFGGNRNLAIGNTIVIEELTKAPHFNIQFQTGGLTSFAASTTSVSIEHLKGPSEPYVAPGGSYHTICVLGALNFDQGVTTYGCDLSWERLLISWGNIMASRVRAPAGSTCTIVLLGGNTYVVGCSMAVDVVYGPGILDILNNCSFTKTLTASSNSPHLRAGNAFSFWNWDEGQAAIYVSFGAILNINNTLWGSSSNVDTYGIRVSEGGYVSYPAGNTPTVAGQAAYQAIVGGVERLYVGEIPYINPDNNAAFVEEA